MLLTTVKHALSVSLYEGIIFLSYFKEKRIKKCQKKDVMQKIFADIITEVSSIACWVYVEKYVHHKSLQEMLAERKDVDKFIFAVDTLFEKFLETEEQQS